jgi:hypothetical protein
MSDFLAQHTKALEELSSSKAFFEAATLRWAASPIFSDKVYRFANWFDRQPELTIVFVILPVTGRKVHFHLWCICMNIL